GLEGGGLLAASGEDPAAAATAPAETSGIAPAGIGQAPPAGTAGTAPPGIGQATPAEISQDDLAKMAERSGMAPAAAAAFAGLHRP
ncbi:hypothetical protein, partial [Acinetobacter baumannii]|uniref:hypothetical protein n=1 Tax=Acinetobacter baumannii TaxID=470 RepID=UPI001C0A5F6E